MKLSIVGTIACEFQIIVDVIERSLPDGEKLRVKNRVFGEEINANSDNWKLFVYMLNNRDYQIEINFFKSIREGLIFLDAIECKLQEANVSYVLDYCLSDSRGNCLTKEKSRSYLKVEV